VQVTVESGEKSGGGDDMAVGVGAEQYGRNDVSFDHGDVRVRGDSIE